MPRRPRPSPPVRAAFPPGRLGDLMRRRDAMLADIKRRGGRVSGIGTGLCTFDARVPPDLARAWLALEEEIRAEEIRAREGLPA